MFSETVILGESGRIVLPAEIRREFGLQPGERLTVISSDGEIRIMSRKMALRRLQDEVAKRVPPGVSLADELIQERREEVRRELEREAEEERNLKSLQPNQKKRVKEPARVA